MDKTNNLTENLKKLTEISDWFDEQESVDVEEGLKKVKVAADLIKKSKQRLKNIENEFEEIKKEIDEDSTRVEVTETIVVKETIQDDEENTSDSEEVPF